MASTPRSVANHVLIFYLSLQNLAMILYNVTLQVEKSIHDDWISWMQRIHIPDVLDTGLILGFRMCELLEVEVSMGPTYTIQYEFENMDNLERYRRDHAPGLQKEHLDRYGERVVAFRTIMKVIHASQLE